MKKVDFQAENFMILKQLENLRVVYHELENTGRGDMNEERYVHLTNQIKTIRDRIKLIFMNNILDAPAMQEEEGLSLIIEMMKRTPSCIESYVNDHDVVNHKITIKGKTDVMTVN